MDKMTEKIRQGMKRASGMFIASTSRQFKVIKELDKINKDLEEKISKFKV